MTKLICLAVSFAFLTTVHAQFRCGFEQKIEDLQKIDRNYKRNIDQLNADLQRYITDHKTGAQTNAAGRPMAATVVIPCVVHVIHTGGAVGSSYNPNDANIIAAIDYLNKVYDGTWTGSGGSILGVGDLQIKFVLANKDPNNAATTGINRLDGSGLANYTANGINAANTTGASEISLKNLSRWDPYKFYNIWLVNKIDGCDGISGCGSFIAGYAYFPLSPNTVANARDLDGTIMLASQMIPGQKTLPHEVGHAFNLYHPFQGETDVAGPNTCPPATPTAGDQCADTDPITNPADDGAASPFACRTGANACGGTYGDNTEKNFMNYTVCYRLFTTDQKTRMQAAAVSTMRASLATSWANNQDAYPYTFAAPVAPAVTVTSSLSINDIAGISYVTLNGRTIHSLNATQDGGFVNKADKWYNLFTLQPNTTYSMSVKTYGANREQLAVFIDYNGDGSFNNTTERLFAATDILTANSLVTFSFTTPATVASGALRLRVFEDVSTVYGVPTITATSNTSAYGQAEDYPVLLVVPGVLPVDVTNFNASKFDGGVRVQWRSNNETHLNHYELERSVNGRDFSSIGTVAPKGASLYNFDDKNVFAGTYHYRLKMVDEDGTFKYTSITSVSYLGTGGFVIQNNPFSDHIRFILAAGDLPYTCRLIDASGKTVQQASGLPSGGAVRLPVNPNLAAGIYILEVRQNGNVFTQKIIK